MGTLGCIHTFYVELLANTELFAGFKGRDLEAHHTISNNIYTTNRVRRLSLLL